MHCRVWSFPAESGIRNVRHHPGGKACYGVPVQTDLAASVQWNRTDDRRSGLCSLAEQVEASLLLPRGLGRKVPSKGGGERVQVGQLVQLDIVIIFCGGARRCNN